VTARLMEGVSGVRGIVDDGLDRAVVRAYATAYHRQCAPGPILIARDPRPSGRELAEAASTTLTSLGRTVVDLGVVPTPTLFLNTRLLEAAGGLMITASHNPEAWNGLKFADPAGRYMAPADSARLIAAATSIRSRKPAADLTGDGPSSPGKILSDDSSTLRHGALVASATGIDLPAIAAAGLTVVVDGVNGAASRSLPRFLEETGVTVHRLHCDVEDGRFPRPPEPLPSALRELGEAVVAHRADLGLGLDPDGDRLALVGPDGIPLGEEATLALAVLRVLDVVPGPVVTNLSTSRMVDDVAAGSSSRVTRTPVGEINVADGMIAEGALIGGEGNGGVIHAEVVLGRDALIGAALVLSAMAASGTDLPTLRARIPTYAMIKERLPLPQGGAEGFLKALADGAAAFEDADRDDRDGLRLDWSDRWIHIRPSNTEPVARLIAEAPSHDEVRLLADSVAGRLGLSSPGTGGQA